MEAKESGWKEQISVMYSNSSCFLRFTLMRIDKPEQSDYIIGSETEGREGINLLGVPV